MLSLPFSCLLAAFGCCPSAPAVPPSLPGSFADLILVEGKVAEPKVREEGSFVYTRVRITHVYHGPPGLVGKTFEDSSTEGFGGLAYSASRAFQAGEKGIWSLQRGESGSLFVGDIWRLGFRLRSREKFSPRYPRVVQLARRIEELGRCDAESRVAFLERHALGATPEVSAWCVHALAALSPPGVDELLKKLLGNEQLSVAGQVAIDEVLSDLARSEAAAVKWSTSGKRLAVLRKWVSGALDEYEGRLVVRRLNLIRQDIERWPDKGPKPGDILALLRIAARNPKVPLKVRKDAEQVAPYFHP